MEAPHRQLSFKRLTRDTTGKREDAAPVYSESRGVQPLVGRKRHKSLPHHGREKCLFSIHKCLARDLTDMRRRWACLQCILGLGVHPLVHATERPRDTPAGSMATRSASGQATPRTHHIAAPCASESAPALDPGNLCAREGRVGERESQCTPHTTRAGTSPKGGHLMQ